jgi:DNA-binding MarR family transcriptional regulator
VSYLPKLSSEQVHELKMLYVHEGWHVIELARKFDIHHTSVLHHVKYLERATPVRPFPKLAKTYDDYLEEERVRREHRRAQCSHENVAIICLCCGTHFEQTKKQPARAKIVFI